MQSSVSSASAAKMLGSNSINGFEMGNLQTICVNADGIGQTAFPTVRTYPLNRHAKTDVDDADANNRLPMTPEKGGWDSVLVGPAKSSPGPQRCALTPIHCGLNWFTDQRRRASYPAVNSAAAYFGAWRPDPERKGCSRGNGRYVGHWPEAGSRRPAGSR
jgi:hypothetical protein